MGHRPIHSSTHPDFMDYYNKIYRSRRFIWTDGGRWEHNLEFARRGKRIGDCPIRSLAIATGTPYAEVWHVCKRFGWRKFDGWYPEPMYDFLENRNPWGHEMKKISVWGRGKTFTLFKLLDDERFQKGIFLVITNHFSDESSHILCVKDGRVYDNTLRDGWVTRVYEVKKLLTN